MGKKGKLTSEIERLQERVRELSESDENKRRMSFWDFESNVDKSALARVMPKTGSLLSFTVDLDRPAYSRILGFSLAAFYADPEEYVRDTLRIIIFKFENIRDCTPIAKSVAYFSGSGFEKSLFGFDQKITEEDAWVGRENAIVEREDLSRLGFPAFRNSPVMKFTHGFYERMRELVEEDFAVEFPQWNRGPWGVAWHLRGIDNLLVDYLEEPDWFRALLEFVTEARKKWSIARAKFLNEPMVPANIYNDEITAPVVSPDMYKDFILPTEVELSRFYGGLSYWHSCGNTTPFLGLINSIPNTQMVHVSPWTDLHCAVTSYDRNKFLELDLHPYQDVLYPPVDAPARQRLETIKREVGESGARATVRADAIQIVEGVEKDMARLREWVECANRVLLYK
jgi:hypothetical protein